ncbi:twin-arginine translocase subunit TatC [Neobacillus sp. LXY-1]|uniref:twin-arginine translocase subunit TatC n=1 Tax=Neobacillus sp. LXY-1 TaxID=3379133 RepID=UPI003EDFC97C
MEKVQGIIEHLDELRNRVIITAVTFIIFMALGLNYVKDIYQFLMGNFHYKLLALGPSDIVRVYFNLAGIVALVGTIPVAAWQLWLFVKPALKISERKTTLAYIPALFILFISGLVFGYFFIFPNILRFLLNLSSGIMSTTFTAEKYFSFLLNITLPFGVAFELPLVMMFLTSLGIVNPLTIAKFRKYACFILVIIASMISPPEFVSHISVAIPLILLYEISIFVSTIVYKRKKKHLELSPVEKEKELLGA